MAALTAACAVYQCQTCVHRASGDCAGCRDGNVQLLKAGEDVCKVYACVTSHQVESCDHCPEPSCELKRSVESLCPLRGRFENRRWWAGRMSRALARRKAPQKTVGRSNTISERVVSRLRWYLTALDQFASEECESVSSWQIGEKVGVDAALIRKDLSRCGEFGTPSFGYRVDFLRERIARILRLDTPRAIAWVGAPCYREHASAVRTLADHGIRVHAVFDSDPAEIGAVIGDQTVLPTDQIASILSRDNADLAAVAVSGPQAQHIAEVLVESGVRAILNLSGELLILPDRIRVCSFDLAGQLIELCYYCEPRKRTAECSIGDV